LALVIAPEVSVRIRLPLLHKAVTARWSANSGGTAEATAFRP